MSFLSASVTCPLSNLFPAVSANFYLPFYNGKLLHKTGMIVPVVTAIWFQLYLYQFRIHCWFACRMNKSTEYLPCMIINGFIGRRNVAITFAEKAANKSKTNVGATKKDRVKANMCIAILYDNLGLSPPDAHHAYR
jgi:hypothetical protein